MTLNPGKSTNGDNSPNLLPLAPRQLKMKLPFKDTTFRELHLNHDDKFPKITDAEWRLWFTGAILKLQLRRDKNCLELVRSKSPV